MASKIAISPDENHFIGGSNGKIYNRALDDILTIDDNKVFTAFAFSENGQKIYAASTKNILYTYSFPNLTQLNATEPKAFNI